MKIKNIGYHTRLLIDQTKVCGGSFGGSLDLETANRLVNRFFNVIVKPSGHPVFVDREGREVRLYFSVDPDMTTKGEAAVKAWRVEKNRQEEEDEQRRAEQQEEIDSAMSGLTHEEIIRRLTCPIPYQNTCHETIPNEADAE